MSATKHSSDWARLFRLACALIRQVNADQTIINHWTFGGGTAMMLQIDHRESHDIDIFLPDPQFLAYLDPQKWDFKLDVTPTEYDGDGARFLKLAFEDMGQIDFIVGPSLTTSPTTRRTIEDETVELENIPEIITKKIYHRGSNIRPRDIFDIAAAAHTHADAIVEALRSYRSQVAKTLLALDKLNPDFVNAAIADMTIRGSYRSIAETAIERARTILSAV
ncbi:nucleotidyl transferase AbiEii/AbiGii toxin family protein [Bradyrhizobium sp. CB3481]|uniref:nucleotidyl transferase AbiEii/AbiGii toxin family protein n=1 Tax=Bradyrhizobium sp. CB3481 TaxID=3039158 RepID=UPI0024B17CDB|nr:nucleotidyl transferase AbiEii/AbiGii toxin family protein [Bradyrhizobium sp. CB3481]WFU16691.1 nucleotidyl transferase AbiEii/AbiGii toxin family protein [Bradyrhizobium sp. CB3481]